MGCGRCHAQIREYQGALQRLSKQLEEQQEEQQVSHAGQSRRDAAAPGLEAYMRR